MQKHHWILLLFLFLAAASYLSGFILGSVVLMILGILLEGAFWIHLLRGKIHHR